MATTTKLNESPFLSEGESFTKDKLLEFIKEKESFSAKAYKDGDHYSIGYGTRASGPDETISKKVAEQRLIQEVDTREKFVRNFAKVKGYDWNDSQVNSLVDFHYNTGQKNFLALTDNGKRSTDEIAAKLPEYNKVDGEFNQGIQNRRFQNQLAFGTPTETTPSQSFAGTPQTVDQSTFTKTPPIQVAANTNPNVASDVNAPLTDTTTNPQVPQSIAQQFGYDPNKFKFNQPQQAAPAPVNQTPFNREFNDNVLKALKDKHYDTAVDFTKGLDGLYEKQQIPNKELNDRVLRGLLASNRRDLAEQYAGHLDTIASQMPQQPQAAPTAPIPPAEPVKEQSALRVLGQTALKEVIPTGVGFGLSEIVGAALAPETGGASLALVPLLVNLGARIGTFVAGHAGGSAVQKNLLPEAVNKTLEQGEAQHPTAAMVGGFLPFGLYGGFGLSKAARKEIGEAYDLYKAGDASKLKSLKTYTEPLVQAGFGAGIEGVSQLVTGEFDPSRILISGMMMPLVSGDKTRLGKAVSFENVNFKPKESADSIINRISKSEFFVPKQVDDIPIINLSKETKGEYATRHGIAETEVDTHQQTRNADKDNVRIHEVKVETKSNLTKSADDLLKSVDEGGIPSFMTPNLKRIARQNGIKIEANTTPNNVIEALQTKRQVVASENKPTIEINYDGLVKEFANKEWTKLYNLPDNAFKDFQSYLDFKIQRTKVEHQEPKDIFKSKMQGMEGEEPPPTPTPEVQAEIDKIKSEIAAKDLSDRHVQASITQLEQDQAKRLELLNDDVKLEEYAKDRSTVEEMRNLLTENYKNAEPTLEAYKTIAKEFEVPNIDKAYESYLNNAAMEEASVNPFFNLDNLGLPPMPKNEKELSDAAFISANAKMIDNIRGIKLYQVALNEGLTPEMQNNIRMHLEGINPNALTKAEQVIFDKYYQPLISELTKAYEYLKNINPELANQLGEMRDGKFFFNRMMNPLTREQIKVMQENNTIENPNFFGKIKNTFAELGGKLEGGFDPDLGKISSASKTRSFWVVEGKNGTREIVQIAKDGKIFKWDNQKATLIGRMPQRDQMLREGDTFFGGKLAQGSIEELETHAPITYNRNSFAVLIQKMNEAREEVRQDAFLKELMASPMMKDIALPTHADGKLQEVPEGYMVPKNVQKYPALAGYMFPTRVAHVINDFARVWDPTVLTNLTNIIVKNMMINPIAHMLNEAFHLYNARGLSGWVTPGGIARFQKTGKEAINDVINLTDFYEETIRLGGSLLAPGTRASAFQDALFGKGLNEFSKTGEFKELANDMGVSLKQLYNNISKQSNRAMWITRDIMYMQYLREIMETKGVSHAEAIVYAEKHMPNYRLPSIIGEKVVGENLGRGLSYVMQNPNISVFSRYHYGMVKSLVNMVREVGAIKKGAEGVKEFKQGVDSAAAVAVALAVMYPMMDMMAKSMTDNDKAKFRRAGPYHLIHAMEDVVAGAKSPAAAMNSVFTWNPALSGLVQLGMNTNWYNGQAIYNPQSDPVTLASDLTRYMGMQLPMASQTLRAQSDRSGEGFDAMAARQIDIESPTAAQYVSTEKRKREAAKDSLRRNLERQLRGF
jgi:GH24 family phage-related lysozyme (muramidase)